MPLELSQLMELAAGHRPSVAVGDLPREVAKYLGCHPAIVFLGTKEFFKIAGKHVRVTSRQLLYLPYLIKDGRYLADPKRRNCVTVFQTHPENGELYLAGIKAVEGGSEAWISTLHRTNPRQEERRVHKSRIIRDYLNK